MEQINDIADCYIALCAAVVVRAGKDYMRLRRLRDAGAKDKSIPADVSNSESFFRSKRFSLFGGDVDPEYILTELDKKYESRRNKRR